MLSSPTWEETTEEVPSWETTEPVSQFPKIELDPYQKYRLSGGEPVAGPFGPANPQEVLALPQVLKAPAAAIEQSGIVDALEQAGADFLQRTGINPAAQPGVPLPPKREGQTFIPSPIEQAFPEATKGVEEALRGFVTPGAVLAAPALASKPVQAAFKAQMASGIPESLQALSQARTPQDIGRAGTALIAQILPLVHGKAIRTEETPETTADEIRPVAPATAAALDEQAKAEKGPSAIHGKTEEVLQSLQPLAREGEGKVSSQGASAEAGARSEQSVPQKAQERITHAAYRDEEGTTFQGANHPQILEGLGVEGFESRESRNTPQFGFITSKNRFVSREQAGRIATKAGQNLEQFEAGEQVHSDQIESLVKPGTPLGDVPQPVAISQETPPTAVTGEVSPTAPAVSTAKVEGVAAPPTEPAKAEPSVTPPVTQEELAPMGMGGATPEEFPEPRQAAVAGSQVEQAAPQDRPMGVLSNVGSALRDSWNSVVIFAKGAAGDTMPKTTAAHRETGEAGARMLSSRIAAVPRADVFVARALQDTGVDSVKFGAALTEDNLQSVRQSLREAAEQERSRGNDDAANELDSKAQNVASIVGSEGSPFATVDEFFDFLEEPMTRKALDQHKQLWQEVVEPQYKEAMGLDPDVELPSRGLNTGARINLKAVTGDEETAPSHPVTGSSGLTATFKRKTPFGIRAKGTGHTYELNYQELMRNTFGKQLEIANKNVFDNALVDSGNAVISKPGQAITMPDGESTVAFPLTRKVIVGQEFTASASRNIYVRKSLAGEYKTASGASEKTNIPVVTPIMNALNRAVLYGLTEGSVHVSNQLTALFDRPVSGKLMSDTLLSATGRADVPVTIARTIMKVMQDNREQLAELAEIGAGRSEALHTGLFGGRMGRLLQSTDRITRLMLDDTYKSLVKEGLAEDTETARREYVNQIGQYNRRAQGPLIRLLRDTGFGPFATAGRTFNTLGVKMVTLSPGTPATSPLAAAALRGNVLSKWVGTAVLLGTLNYVLTKDKGGGIMGRPGTKIGDLDLGINDKTGKQLSIPVASIIGVGRGLRVTGARGAIEAKRMGLSNADAFDAAARDIFNSWTAPAVGPAVKAATIASTGYPPAIRVGRSSAVVPPGESQTAENIKEAAIEANPIINTLSKIREGKTISEIAGSQVPRLAPTAGKTESMVADYPRIVKAAQANEFINYIVHETRRQDPDSKLDFATKQIDRLPDEFKKKAWDELKHRRVFAE